MAENIDGAGGAVLRGEDGSLYTVVNSAYVEKIRKLEEHAAKLQAQQDAVKEMAREAEKKSEIAKHKTPQIKRSINFLLSSCLMILKNC